MKRFTHRHLPSHGNATWIKSGLGAMVAMGIIGWIGEISHEALLIAPFGASCVLLFAVPSSPLAQPVNVIGGHMVASVVGLLMHLVLPSEWWAIAIAVGVAITAMAALRVTHPPAGAVPVVIFLSNPGWDFLLVPIFSGSLVLVGVATIIHMLPPRTAYPLVIGDVVNDDSAPPSPPGKTGGDA